MDSNCQSSSQQTLWKDVEVAKEKKSRYRSYQLGALVVTLLVLSLTLCVFSLKHFWTPGSGKVYGLQYRVLLDGVEVDSLMEIDPANRLEIFRTGNGTDEVLEVHDFKNGIAAVLFARHQRCYIRAQTKEFPEITAVQREDMDVEGTEIADTQFEDSQVWVPAEEPIENRAVLLSSRISEMCEHLPVHWIHPSSLNDAKLHDTVDAEVEKESEAGVKGRRQARDVTDYLDVNDYRENGIELDDRLDETGVCCQHCRRGYRFCQRYYQPLGGYMPHPYYYHGGVVICRIVMPCNWWIARMLGRV
ncbi:tenomodulin [Lepisosteus oculatus]|uniref:Tenomodulin n=1 Tax=Lepisosteus oculatus TaxID=7918 RepID=W5NE27_LEPOC|nr:PREDICTED: tenomodulin [Lepisosteus oculatus]